MFHAISNLMELVAQIADTIAMKRSRLIIAGICRYSPIAQRLQASGHRLVVA